MVGRPRQFDEQVVLERAMMAFWHHGYLGTGVQELVEATGINRASLYGTFGNKHDLFVAALRRYTELCLARLRGALEQDPEPVAGVRAMLDAFKADILEEARGCMLYNTALEISAYDEELRRRVQAGMEQIEQMLVRHLREAQANGALSPTPDATLLARVVMAAMQSMTVRSGAGADADLLHSIRDGAMLVFKHCPASDPATPPA